MNEYKNWKVERAFELLAEHGIHMTEQDFADLAIASADQAGLHPRDQHLFNLLLTAAIDTAKNKRSPFPPRGAQ